MIDTHVHFWQLERGDYGWLTRDRAQIYRDFLPDDFAGAMDGTPVSEVIAVQAAPSEAETQWLHEQARRYDWIVGVTGWIDLTGPNPEAALRRIRGDGKLVGIRPMEGVGRGPNWLNETAFARGIEDVAASGLVFEALLLPHHLPGLLAIARRHSEMPIIINHVAKPTPETFAAWVTDLDPFHALDNVSCKLSGLTAQSMDMAFHARVFDALAEVFGMDRLIWGSDHPVLLESACYQTWLDTTHRLLGGLDGGERNAVLAENARRLYGLKQGRNHG